MSDSEMVLASVHLQPAVGVPVAVVAVLGILWQAVRLAGPHVPRPRRRVRRTAAAVMTVIVGLVTVGACFIDPAQRPTAYVLTWSLTLLMLVVLVGVAVLDALVSTWLIRLERDGDAMKRGLAALAALDAMEAAEDAEAAADGSAVDGGRP